MLIGFFMQKWKSCIVNQLSLTWLNRTFNESLFIGLRLKITVTTKAYLSWNCAEANFFYSPPGYGEF